MPWGRQDDGPAQVAEALREAGARTLAVQADLTDVAAPGRVFDAVEAGLGPVTALVMCHCECVNSGLLDTTVESFDRHYAVNVRASWLLVKEYGERPRPVHGAGRIVALTSDHVVGNLPYGATKGALDRLVIASARELAHLGTTANVVNPGPVDTGWMDDALREGIRGSPPSAGAARRGHRRPGVLPLLRRRRLGQRPAAQLGRRPARELRSGRAGRRHGLAGGTVGAVRQDGAGGAGEQLGGRDGRPRLLQRAHPHLVRGRVRRADAGPGRRLAGDRAPAATRWWSRRPAPARRSSAFLWAIDRLADRAAARGQAAALPGALRLAAQGARRRRRAQPARAADRHPADRRPARRAALPDVTVGVRSGDTPAADRRRLGTHAARHPDHHPRVAVPDAHLARPARVAARRRDGDRRRGARRRRHQARRPPRAVARAARRAARRGPPSGSACPRPCGPLEEVARFLGGTAPVEVVAPPSAKQWDLKVVVPGRGHDRARAGGDADELPEGSAAGSAERRGSIWPHVEERVVDLIEQHRSTIVFANSRRLAERLTARLNEIAAERAGRRGRRRRAARARPQMHGAVAAQSDGAADR